MGTSWLLSSPLGLSVLSEALGCSFLACFWPACGCFWGVARFCFPACFFACPFGCAFFGGVVRFSFAGCFWGVALAFCLGCPCVQKKMLGVWYYCC